MEAPSGEPEVGGPKIENGGLKGGPPKGGAPKGGSPKFRAFFPPPQFSFFLHSLGGLLVELWALFNFRSRAPPLLNVIVVRNVRMYVKTTDLMFRSRRQGERERQSLQHLPALSVASVGVLQCARRDLVLAQSFQRFPSTRR